MQKIFSTIEIVANTDAPVFVTGETGTGKELVARAVHELSRRFHHPFIALNCAALPKDMIESELFGHEKGSFTGAISTKIGLCEVADGGTLFLDEIGEMSPQIQTKMLRFLQEGEFYRIGGKKPIRVNVRILSATNRDLADEVKAGRFREDLFYRLNVVPLPLLSLFATKSVVAVSGVT
jgi:transcriptional regulator with GAF, ATPase, and Fis domain